MTKGRFQHSTARVPVVINVSNWDAKEGTFDQWLLNEVARRHSKDVDRDALRQLLVNGELALLLDGVDEHAEPADCARVINAMLDHHKALPVVVAYRSDPTDPVRPQVIEQHLGWLDEGRVLPLDRDTIDRLLADAGDDWTGVRQVIAANADLWEPPIRRPLLLAVIMRAFRRKPGDAIPALHGSVEDRQAELYDAYLDSAVRQRRHPESGKSPLWEVEAIKDSTPVRAALAWLADTADRCGLGTTVYLEQIASAWLPNQRDEDRTGRQQLLAVWMVVGLVLGLLFGLGVELAVGLGVALLGGLAIGLAAWLPDQRDQDRTGRRQRLAAGMARAVPGGRLTDISHAVGVTAARYGYGTIPDFGGHGIGRAMHEPPSLPNASPRPRRGPPLREGLVLAIEPMLNDGPGRYVIRDDGWAVATADGSLAAHFEHTVAVTGDGPRVLTAA